MEKVFYFFFNSRPLLFIGDIFEILKNFPKYPKGGPLGFFCQGYPPPKKNFFNAFLDELRIQKKNAERV